MATRATGFDWEIQNQRAFEDSLNRLGEQTNNFKVPFALIASDFYRSQRKLFTLQGAGLYQDLAPATGIDGNPTTTSNYKKQKEKKLGFVYPILVGQTGTLRDSTLSANARFSVFFLGFQELTIGTEVPYGQYHQSDKARSVIPQRKFIFIDGGPADRSSDSSINGRRERWTKIIEDHVEQLVTGRVL